jgi:predicted transposase/invertase (TIGR01784 family)
MARYLDPKNDLTFKRIFGEHPELVINFLNAVLPLASGQEIESIEYLPTAQPPDRKGEKNSIVDVKCKDINGRFFIVEMQTEWSTSFRNRLVFNAGKAYIRQLDSGENYNLLKPVYSLAILTENFDHKTDKFYHHFQLVNRDNINEIIPGLEFVLIELTDKFRPETLADRKLMCLWLRFLKEVNEGLHSLPPEMQENELISYAAQLCEIGAYTPEELALYEGYQDAIWYERGIKAEYEEIGMEKGKAEGKAIGEAIGLEKGKAEGKAENQIETVLNAHQAGLSLEQIQMITKLTAEQITEILKQHKLI